VPDKPAPPSSTNANDSGAIGRQITLPLSKAFEIAWKGIQVRLWRSVITMSGVILAIAFLMSVWTAGVFDRTMKEVGPDCDPELGTRYYALIQGVIEKRALAAGAQSIRTRVLAPATTSTAPGGIPAADGLHRALDAHANFRAQVATGSVGDLANIDVLITLGFPAEETLAETGSETIRAFVERGGVWIIYGTRGLPAPSAEQTPLTAILPALMPVIDGKNSTKADGATIKDHKDSPLAGIVWTNHPAAFVAFLKPAADAVPLATSGETETPVALRRLHGEGAIALYAVHEASMDNPDVVSWFVRGEAIADSSDIQAGESLLVRLGTSAVLDRINGNSNTRGIWLVSLSLLVCVVGITNAMLMSVTERYREIGTMKCLGALDSFIVKLFLIESSMQGLFGSLIGAVLGFLLAFLRILFTFHVTDQESGESYWLALKFFPVASLAGWMAIALLTGMLLSVIAAIYPATRAARMAPVDAMRQDA